MDLSGQAFQGPSTERPDGSDGSVGPSGPGQIGAPRGDGARSVLVSPLVRLLALRSPLSCATALALSLGLGAPGPASAAARRTSRAARRPPAPVILPASASAWDLAVGQAARNGLGRAQGAVVAMDPHTGRVHALVNPALGMQRGFQPCSVFKIVVGIAGLSEGVITPDTTLPLPPGLLDVGRPRPDRPASRARGVLQPVLRVGGRAARLREDPALRAPARAGGALGHQPHRGDGGTGARVRPAGRRGPPLEPRGGHRDLGRAARRARLGDGERRRRS